MPKKSNAIDCELRGSIEAILFVAGEPVKVKDLAAALEQDPKDLERVLGLIQDEYDYEQRGFCLKRFGEHVQLATRAVYAPVVEKLLQPVQKQSLTQTVMETLAVIAYRQPVTKAEIELIRGVKCDYSVSSLVSKGMIQDVGRKDTVGHPILYGTTDKFLGHFGISTLDELPPLPQDIQETIAREDAELLVP